MCGDNVEQQFRLSVARGFLQWASISLRLRSNNWCSFFYVPVTVLHRNKFLYNKTNQMHQFHKFILAWNSTCFGQFFCTSSGVYSLYTQQWYMSHRFVDSFRALLESCLQTGIVLLQRNWCSVLKIDEIWSCWYPQEGCLGGSYNRFGRFREEKNLVPLPEMQESSLDFPSLGLPIPTELSLLF